MHAISIAYEKGVEHKLDFSIFPVNISGIVALHEAGNEYGLEIDEF
jgi:hypothetical protein